MSKAQPCPKCLGPLHVEEDSVSMYSHCVKCGYMHELTNIIPLPDKRDRVPLRHAATPPTTLL